MKICAFTALVLATPIVTECRELFAVTSSGMRNAIDDVRDRFPNLKASNRSNSPKFVDSHPKFLGTGHAELDGFGVTMVAHNGIEPRVSFDKILNADDPILGSNVENPNLLFFEKGSSSNTR